jgi:hypothetical protein
MDNLLGGPAPTLLTEDDADRAAQDALLAGADPRDAVLLAPASSYLWAVLAENALSGTGEAADAPAVGLESTGDGAVVQGPAIGAPDPVAAYAFARTGYHRGLDALRRAGWRGAGPVPLEHRPNQGFLRSLLALAEAADVIGEPAEAQRCREFLVALGTSADEVAALR